MKARRNSSPASGSHSNKRSPTITQSQRKSKCYERSLNVYKNKENADKMTEKMSDICARSSPFLQNYSDLEEQFRVNCTLCTCEGLTSATHAALGHLGSAIRARPSAALRKVSPAVNSPKEKMKEPPGICMKTLGRW